MIPLPEQSSLIHFKYCCWASSPLIFVSQQIAMAVSSQDFLPYCELPSWIYVCCHGVICVALLSPFLERLTGFSNSWIFTVSWLIPLMSRFSLLEDSPNMTIKRFGYLVVTFVPNKSTQVETVHSLKMQGENDELKAILALL